MKPFVKNWIGPLIAALGMVQGAQGDPATAGLERGGPASAVPGVPAWYQDKTGLALELGLPLNQAELDGGWCLILPAGSASETVEMEQASAQVDRDLRGVIIAATRCAHAHAGGLIV